MKYKNKTDFYNDFKFYKSIFKKEIRQLAKIDMHSCILNKLFFSGEGDGLIPPPTPEKVLFRKTYIYWIFFFFTNLVTTMKACKFGCIQYSKSFRSKKKSPIMS